MSIVELQISQSVELPGPGRGTHEALDIVAGDDTGLAAQFVFGTHFESRFWFSGVRDCRGIAGNIEWEAAE
jgi:hypothetical protein